MAMYLQGVNVAEKFLCKYYIVIYCKMHITHIKISLQETYFRSKFDEIVDIYLIYIITFVFYAYIPFYTQYQEIQEERPLKIYITPNNYKQVILFIIND